LEPDKLQQPETTDLLRVKLEQMPCGGIPLEVCFKIFTSLEWIISVAKLAAAQLALPVLVRQVPLVLLVLVRLFNGGCKWL